jgi:hypothetical protein
MWAHPIGAVPCQLVGLLPLCLVGSPCRRPGMLCARASVSLFHGPRLPVPLPSFNRSPVRTARTHTEIAAPTSPPSAKLASRHPLQVPAHPRLTHFTHAHSPELRAPILQARRSFPVARPSAPESAAGRARPPSPTMLRHRQAQPCHRSRPT